MRAKSKTSTRRRVARPRVLASSGNVFADLGIAHPDLALAKAELVQRIRELIEAQSLSQAHAARLLGIDQPKVSALVRGRVEGYTLDRHFRFLTALGQRIEISISQGAKGRAIAVVD